MGSLLTLPYSWASLTPPLLWAKASLAPVKEGVERRDICTDGRAFCSELLARQPGAPGGGTRRQAAQNVCFSFLVILCFHPGFLS